MGPQSAAEAVAVMWPIARQARARLAKRVQCPRNARRVVSVGPLRLLAMIASATPLSGVSVR